MLKIAQLYWEKVAHSNCCAALVKRKVALIWYRAKKGGLEIPCAVNAKLIGTKKKKEILAMYLEMVQNHYTEPSSDEDVIMGSFLAMSVNEDVNSANRIDCTKCINKEGKNKSLKNVTIPNPKLSSDIRTFFKRAEDQREQVTPETEGNIPSNASK